MQRKNPAAAPRLILTVMAILFVICSCKKSDKPVVNGSLPGEWTLTEYLFDPGDGSGVWTNPSQPAPTIHFKSDGTVTYSGSPSASRADRYLVKNDSVLVFIGSPDSTYCRYKIFQGVLSITPPCIEACGLHYKRN